MIDLLSEDSLVIDTDLARSILTGFIKSEITRVGFQHAVIGLSGGLDSSLSCYLASEALGSENILALRMPYKSSSQELTEPRPTGDRHLRCEIANRAHH